MAWIDLQAAYHFQKDTLEKCILAEVGYAQGHTFDGNPLYCDETTLAMWCELIKKSEETIPCTLNHSGDIRDVIAELVKDTVEVVDGKLVASVRFLQVAFERSTNYIGEFISSLAKEDNSLVNISVETEIDAQVKDGVAIMRPKFLDAISLVISGALTHKLQNFSTSKQVLNINTHKESNMAEEIKQEEVKPEEVKPEEAKPAEEKPAEVKPAEVKPAEVKPAEVKPEEAKPEETKPEEVKAAEPTLADVVAKIDALSAMINSLMGMGEELKATKAELATTKAELSKKTQTVKLAATSDIEVAVVAAGPEKLDLQRIKTDSKYYAEHKNEYFKYLRKEAHKGE